MTSQAIGIILTNAVLLICAVWRLSWLLSKMESLVAQVVKDHEKDAKTVEIRLNAQEARILTLEQARSRAR